MKKKILLPTLIFIIFAGCSNKTGKNINDNQKNSDAVHIKSNTDKKNEISKPHLLRQIIHVTAIGNSEKGDKIDINFTIDPLDQIKGNLIIKNMTLNISGIFFKNTIRCWLAGSDTSTKTVWRGMIIGKHEGNLYKGTITISDNAAENRVTANWTSTNNVTSN